MTDGFDDMQKFGRKTMDRAVESVGALSRGVQALANESAGFSRLSFEAGAAHLEKLLGAQSLDVAVQVQADFLRGSYEKSVGQAARFGEIYLDVVKDVAKPFETAS